MPELPEVETVKKVLKKRVVGKTISGIDVYVEKIIKQPELLTFINNLSGETITDVRRRGKYLFIDTTNYTLVSHLRMEGKYFFQQEKLENTKHDCVIFNFSDDTALVYNDTRRFGTMELVALHDEGVLKGITKLGVEPNEEALTVEYIKSHIGRKNTKVKLFLLDQTTITGLGNIYVDEILYKAKIHPETPITHLDDNDFTNIIKFTNIIIQHAINSGGTTVKTFSIDGVVDGKFQLELEMYGRKGEECYTCNTTIEKIKVGGRGTCFCPRCQEIK